MTLQRFGSMPRCTLVFLVVLALTVTAFYPFAGGSGFSGRAEAAELSTSKGVACSDTSRHITRFVRIERRAQLEVLDWGGSGDLLVFLTGLGNSAHIFDNFAYQFTDRFRVIGITRRGYGQSSQTPQGYDLATRVADIIKVLDYFNFDKAIFVGHSIAGVELSRLGSAYPDRVSKLVYLDAYDYGELHNQIPPAAGPESMATARDGYSPQHGDAFSARYMGYRGVTADTCNIARIGPSGAVGSAKTPAWITSTIIQNSGVADFDLITAPTLGIFAHPQAIPPYVSQLSTEQQEAFDLSMQSLEVWQEDVYQRMSAGIPDFQIHLLSNAAHYIFLTNEAEVVRHMRAFLLGE